MSLWEVIASIPHEQSDDSVSVQKCSMFVGLGPTSILIFPAPPVVLLAALYGPQDRSLSEPWGSPWASSGYSALEIAGEAEGAVRGRHKVANKKPTSSNCYLGCLCFFLYIEFLEIPPFNKQYTESQLRAGAGYILEDFNEAQVRSFFVKLPRAQWWRARLLHWGGPRRDSSQRFQELGNGQKVVA